MKRYLCFLMVVGIVTIERGTLKIAYAQNQSAFTEIQFLTQQAGIGVRAAGMGGAFIGVANDYSAVFWNPGGLAFIKSKEAFGSMSNDRTDNSTLFFNKLTKSNQSFTRLNSFGILSPVNVYRGGFTVGLGVNRVINYNGVFSVAGFNSSPDDSVFQREDITEEGGVYNATLSGGVEVAKGLGIGVSFNFWFGSHKYNSLFTENDNLNLYTLNQYDNNRYINSKIKGFDMTVGLLYRPVPYFQLGAAMTTPQYFSISEDYETNEDYFYDNNSGKEDKSYVDDGVYNYEVSLPYKFGFGAAFTSKILTVSGAIEYRDWTQTRYDSEPPLSGLNRGRANLDIRMATRSVVTKRVGMELNMIGFPVIVRGGYSETPSPLRLAPQTYTQKTISAGLGVKIAQNISLDVTYLYRWWNSETIDELISIPVLEEKSENNILAGLTVRF